LGLDPADQIPADRERVNQAAAPHPPERVDAAIRHTAGKYLTGEITSSVVGYFASVVGKVDPRQVGTTESPAQRTAKIHTGLADRLCRDLSLPPKRFLERALAVVGQYTPDQIATAKAAVHTDARAKLVDDNNPEALYERFLQRLEAPPDETDPQA
jgi:hypothetical protein